ncbi:hypothetical protein ACP4OV_030742 [Aristida adscensionis]
MGDQMQLRRPAAIEKIAVPESAAAAKKAFFFHAAQGGKHHHHQHHGSAGGAHEAPALTSPRTAAKHAVPASPRTCLCSPTTHAGSFRCRLHRAALHEMGKDDKQPAAGV